MFLPVQKIISIWAIFTKKQKKRSTDTEDKTLFVKL